MRRYTTLLMVAVLVAIAVSAFLNLLLGTVSIPAKDVLDILLTGNGENEGWRKSSLFLYKVGKSPWGENSTPSHVICFWNIKTKRSEEKNQFYLEEVVSDFKM